MANDEIPELPVIAGMPVDQSALARIGAPTIKPYPDSVQTTCEKCGRAVWLGPEQQKAKAQHGYLVACYLCLAKLGTPEDDIAIRALSNKQTTVEWPFKGN